MRVVDHATRRVLGTIQGAAGSTAGSVLGVVEGVASNSSGGVRQRVEDGGAGGGGGQQGQGEQPAHTDEHGTRVKASALFPELCPRLVSPKLSSR